MASRFNVGCKIKFCLTFLLLGLCLDPSFCVKTNNSINFNRETFIVQFKPFIAPGDNGGSYDVHELYPIIRKISTRFSKIFLHYFSRSGINLKTASNNLIATAVARVNASPNKTASVPMKVFLSFISEEPSTNHTQSLFTLTSQIADRENSISPGTVEYLILVEHSFGPSMADNAKRQLEDARMELANNSTKYKYKLGAQFLLVACRAGENKRDRILIPLLNYLDLVIFDFSWPTQEYYDFGAYESYLRITEQFQRCLEKLNETHPNIEVGFRLSWSDTDFQGKQNFSSLVLFWEKMNDWGRVTNTKIFMEEAFDQPPLSLNKGWWRLKPQPYFDSTDYIFEDKNEVAIQMRESNLEATITNVKSERSIVFPSLTSEKEGGSISSMVIISVITSFLILTVTGALIFFLYKKALRKMDSRQQNLLTKEEVQEFFEGAINNQLQAGGLEAGEGMNKSLNIPYNKEYELPTTSFTIDETSQLGMGTFGVVCRGNVFKESSEVAVAVKMVKKACPPTALRGLLSEIKVLSFLGNHENVVGLIGAYTKELRRGKVYVFTELCCHGSLEKHLKLIRSQEQRACMGTATSYVEVSDIEVTYSESVDPTRMLDVKDLHRWSYEIANGMEFLASKHVVHADLATRNILLASDMSAKISDFGLSRRLYDYTNYVKSDSKLLPWRHLSPECLLQLVFNEKTDVWAYGVTLWEIYSLGDVPYPGLSWSIDFATKLLKGLRMEEPQYNADNMYTLMLNCWNSDPVKRPNFVQIKERLISQTS